MGILSSTPNDSNRSALAAPLLSFRFRLGLPFGKRAADGSHLDHISSCLCLMPRLPRPGRMSTVRDGFGSSPFLLKPSHPYELHFPTRPPPPNLGSVLKFPLQLSDAGWTDSALPCASAPSPSFCNMFSNLVLQ